MTNDHCIATDSHGSYKGYCFDIWDKISHELNISHKWIKADNYFGLLKLFKDGTIDVIVERLSLGAMANSNQTK